MSKITLTEIKKGQTGTGLLIENDGFISLNLKGNEMLSESLKLNEENGVRNIPNPLIVSAVFQKYGIENANGRIYPEDILKREVEKYMQAIQERRAYGECYTPDALCLTKEGWKNIADVKEGDEILTLNVDTNKIEIEKISKKVEVEWDDNLIHISGNHIDDMVTPNHGFPLYDRNHKFKGFFTAEEMLNSKKEFAHNYIPKRGIWEGEEKEEIIIPSVNKEYLPKNIKKELYNKYTQNMSIPTDIFCAFMGIYLSEGCLRKGRGYAIQIVQKKEEICKKIVSLLDDWGIGYKVYGKIGEKQTYVISDARLYKYCSQFGLCYDKFIPYDIKCLSANYLQIFYDWFVMGDGRIRGTKYISTDVFSTSEKLALDLNEIQLKIGNSGSFHKEKRNKDRLIEGRLIKGENSHDMYFTYLSKTSGIYIDKRFLSFEKKHYKGKVFCVEVPNHTWYVMQNGKCHWTKNCNHPDSTNIDISRIAMNIVELHWEGHTLVGKIELPITEGYRKLGIISCQIDQVAHLILSGLKIGVSSRGLGSVSQVPGGKLVVGDDYEIVCWDVVSQPSTPGAWIDMEEEKLRPYMESKKPNNQSLIKEDKLTKFENWLNG